MGIWKCHQEIRPYEKDNPANTWGDTSKFEGNCWQEFRRTYSTAGSSEILYHPWCVKVVNSVRDFMSISAMIFPSTVSRDVWCFTYVPGLKEIPQKVLFKMIFRFLKWDVGRYVFGGSKIMFSDFFFDFGPWFWVWNPLWQFCFVEHTNCFKFSVVNLMTPDTQKIWPFIWMETQCFFPQGPWFLHLSTFAWFILMALMLEIYQLLWISTWRFTFFMLANNALILPMIRFFSTHT